MISNLSKNDTIIAPTTAPGMGAIAVIRISGPEAIEKTSAQFKKIKSSKSLLEQASHTVHFGNIYDEEKLVDEVLVTLFKGPNSYTGEDTIEISCHGSTFIQQQIIQLFLKKGIRMADAGEFTMRAFMNGKLDLAQAEAVADLIHSTSESTHELALKQMRGGFSSQIEELRQELLNFASLIELELDFSQEDVEFADRTEFRNLISRIQSSIKQLLSSFALGNVLKNGVPVAIVGEPNVGKSTLLNALLNEDRAIVSDIAGTTRDVIEDEINIKGINFRFIDTAGIRETKDTIESIGIEKTFEKMDQARIVMHLLDAQSASIQEIEQLYQDFRNKYGDEKALMITINKIDLSQLDLSNVSEEIHKLLFPISAKEKQNIDDLRNRLHDLIQLGEISTSDVIISNNRHYDALNRANESLEQVNWSMDNNVASDLMAIDIQSALQALGEITGQITNDDLLGNIFGKFCIGK